MKLVNNTKFNNAKLRRVLSLSLAEVRKFEGDGVVGNLKASQLVVHLMNAHHHCSYHGVGRTVYVYLPSNATAMEAATTFINGLGMCLSYTHRLAGSYTTFLQTIPPTSLMADVQVKDDHPLKRAAIAASQKRKEFEHAVALVRSAQTRLKRATTILKARLRKAKRLARKLGVEFEETR